MIKTKPMFMPEVTFEVRDEVYDWLEARADENMMNISSTVERLLVQKYKDEIKQQKQSKPSEQSSGEPSEVDVSGDEDVEDMDEGEDDVEGDGPDPERITSEGGRRELLEHVEQKEANSQDQSEEFEVPEEDDEGSEEGKEEATAESSENGDEDTVFEPEEGTKPLLEKYAEHWYLADAESGKYALRVPDDAEITRDIKYYQNKDALQDGISRFYVDRPEVWR